MSHYALIAAGGLAGSLARYWLTGIVQQAGEFGFPMGTLAVNILGSLLIGLVMTLSLERGLIGLELRLLLTAGFCGGFTTMSAFSYETVALLGGGAPWRALANVAATNIACVAAVWVGIVAARLL